MRFTLRDLFWLTTLAAVGCACWLHATTVNQKLGVAVDALHEAERDYDSYRRAYYDHAGFGSLN